MISSKDVLRRKIYGILFDHSRVDVIRYCNEDEWPIDELADLCRAEAEKNQSEGGKTWYMMGDELVIKRGNWIIERIKRDLMDYEAQTKVFSIREKIKEVTNDHTGVRFIQSYS